MKVSVIVGNLLTLAQALRERQSSLTGSGGEGGTPALGLASVSPAFQAPGGWWHCIVPLFATLLCCDFEQRGVSKPIETSCSQSPKTVALWGRASVGQDSADSTEKAGMYLRFGSSVNLVESGEWIRSRSAESTSVVPRLPLFSLPWSPQRLVPVSISLFEK